MNLGAREWAVPDAKTHLRARGPSSHQEAVGRAHLCRRCRPDRRDAAPHRARGRALWTKPPWGGQRCASIRQDFILFGSARVEWLSSLDLSKQVAEGHTRVGRAPGRPAGRLVRGQSGRTGPNAGPDTGPNIYLDTWHHPGKWSAETHHGLCVGRVRRLYFLVTVLSCQQVVDFCLEFLDGSLPDEERRRFQSHLGRCPDCVGFFETYRRTPEISRDAFALQMPESLKETVRSFLRARCKPP